MEDVEQPDISQEAYLEAMKEMEAEKQKKEPEPEIEVEEQEEQPEEQPEIEVEVGNPEEEPEKPEPEEKPAEKPQKTPEEKPEEKPEERPAEEFEADVKAYIEKHGVTEKEAREEVEHIYKQLEQYNNDPKQLAKAVLNAQRGYSKLEAQLKQVPQPKPVELSAKSVKERIESGEWVVPTGKTQDGQQLVKAWSKQDVVQWYCKTNPDVTEDLEDSKVFELACREIANHANERARRDQETLPERAKLRRAEILSSVKEHVPEHLVEELTASIKDLSDTDIINPEFDVKYAATFVKGAHFDEEIEKARKEGYEKGLKEGKENVELVTPPTNTGKTASRGAVKIRLTREQQNRAESMFADQIASGVMTKAEAYKDYVDIHSSEFPQLKKEKK